MNDDLYQTHYLCSLVFKNIYLFFFLLLLTCDRTSWPLVGFIVSAIYVLCLSYHSEGGFTYSTK